MTEMFRDKIDISLTVNGEPVEARVPAGQHLVDFLRGELGLTGAHASCEHGVCGAPRHGDGNPSGSLAARGGQRGVHHPRHGS